MGFFQPAPPPFDLEEWKAKPFLSRMRPVVQDWAVNGFGAPGAIYVLYVLKLIVFVVGAALVISLTTPGIGGLGDFRDWWFQPIVFQKAVAWTMLWEILGLGSGSLPLAARYIPPIGGVIYWLRPGTVRLAPWPGKVPLTRGTTRTVVDVALYAGVLATLVYLLTSGGEAAGGFEAGRLEPAGIVVLLGLLALLGLRDKVSFLAARPEIYGLMLLVSLWPLEHVIVGWQLVFICIWWGAAASKLNRHFPFVIATMVSNTPWNRSRRMKAQLYEDYPERMRPSWRASLGAHLGTAVEFGLPLILLITRGEGILGTFALIGMIIFHVHITSTFALGVPLEWNLFMIFGLGFLYGHYAGAPLADVDPLMLAVIVLVGIMIPVLGNLAPERISFLPSMRYYAGNWATSQWLFRIDTDAEGKLDRGIRKSAPITIEQLTRLYGRESAEHLMAKALAFRALHSHGRALFGLLPRAAEGTVEDYDVREGELVSGVVNGWNFGDGHFHHLQLLEAVQERCGFEPGEVRVVALESQPAHVQRQRYRIYDAATGLIEEGFVDVADMCARGPWLEGDWDFPVEVTSARRPDPVPRRAAAPA
jgi:Transmembrane protein of unknown function (DUF3556)